LNSTIGNLQIRKQMKSKEKENRLLDDRPQQKPDHPSKLETFKWFLVGVLWACAVVLDVVFVQPIAIRAVAWTLLIAVTAVIVSQTRKGKQWFIFFKQSQAELRKVVWPTRQEVVQTTLVVIAIVLLVGVILWGIDTLILWLIGFLTGQRG
jgi:preprotein translocase subunit SecE